MTKTIDKNITVNNLIKELNLAVADLQDTRVNDWGKFHDDVRDRINPVLAQVGLEYRTWYIRPIDGTEHPDELLRLDIYKREDRTKNNWRGKGRVLKLWFKPADEMVVADTDTVPILASYRVYLNAKKSLQSQHEYVAKLKRDLAEAERIANLVQFDLARAVARNTELRELRAAELEIDKAEGAKALSRIQLADDGTLDTVLRCSECKEEFRFNFSADGDNYEETEGGYNRFVDDMIAKTEEEHECPTEPDWCVRYYRRTEDGDSDKGYRWFKTEAAAKEWAQNDDIFDVSIFQEEK